MNLAVERPGASPQPRESVLVYRDRLVPRSEVHFLRRQYMGFERLAPVWIGCRTDAGLAELGAEPMILGRPGPIGDWDRFIFKQLGRLPPQPDLKELRPRIVHAQFGRGGALALPIARALGIPLVVTYHGGDATKDKHYDGRFPPTIYQRRLAQLQREAARFICVSEFVRDRLVARGFPPEKLQVVRCGVEIDAHHASERPADPPFVLFVGRFVEKKGIPHLIEAARMLAEEAKPVRLVLAGDGPLAGELRERARGLENVVFTGWLPSKEVLRYMRGAAALCVPSTGAKAGDAEGLPYVILEAMAEGTPVIGSMHAGIGEAIEHGKTGLLVPPGAPRQLAEAIRAVAGDPEFRRALGAAARNAAQERFNAASQSRILEETLIEVIREHDVNRQGAEPRDFAAAPQRSAHAQ